MNQKESLSPIVFLNPPSPNHCKLIRTFDCATESKGNYLYQPFDFLALSGRFDPSENIIFIDAVADGLDSDAYNRRLSSITGRIFIQAFADCNWAADFTELCRLRSHFPNSTILVFGDSFLDSVRVNQVKEHCNGVITNPFSFSPSAIQEHGPFSFYPSPENKFHFSQKPLQIGRPRHDLFLNPQYRWPFARHKRYTSIYAAWGCPFSCEYCIVSAYPYIPRDTQEVIEDLKNASSLGIKEIYFCDRSFGVNGAATRTILNSILSNNLNISWSAYFHPNCYNSELLELFKRTGCHTLIIGIESPQHSVLKAHKRYVSSTKLESLLKHAKQLNIDVCGDFIFGLPGQSAADCDDLISYALSLPLSYASFNILAPLPGTIIRKEAIKKKGNKFYDSRFNSHGTGDILGTDLLTSTELLGFRKRAVRSFYFRPQYLIKKLLHISSFEHFSIQIAEAWALLRKN